MSASHEFTPQQLKNFAAFVRVQETGKFNMLDPRARAQASLSADEWVFCMEHYDALEAATKANDAATPATAPTAPFTIPITITHTLTPEFLQDIMTTAVEAAYEWFAFSNVVRLPEGHERALCITSFDAIETDEDGAALQTNFIQCEQIAYAMKKILGGTYVHKDHMASIAQACAENDASHIDADLADCILQVACFDEVRYG